MDNNEGHFIFTKLNESYFASGAVAKVEISGVDQELKMHLMGLKNFGFYLMPSFVYTIPGYPPKDGYDYKTPIDPSKTVTFFIPPEDLFGHQSGSDSSVPCTLLK